jgi:hypothetical protein
MLREHVVSSRLKSRFSPSGSSLQASYLPYGHGHDDESRRRSAPVLDEQKRLFFDLREQIDILEEEFEAMHMQYLMGRL